MLPWSPETNPSDNAGTNSPETAPKSGHVGVGSDRGTSVTSPKVTTDRSSTATAAEVRTTATTSPVGPIGVRWSPMIRTIVATPIAIPLHRNDDTFRTVSMNWAILFEPELSYPVRLSSWPRMIDTATALTNPVRTAWETNRARRPTRRIPPTRRTRPVRRVRQARIRRIVGIVGDRWDIGDDHRHRARGLDAHQRGRCRQRPDGQADQVGVEAEHRVDASEQSVGEAVGHGLGTENEPRPEVRADGVPIAEAPAHATRCARNPRPM